VDLPLPSFGRPPRLRFSLPRRRALERLREERLASGRRAIAAQEEERKRVARELHDEIGQALTALVIELDGLARAGGASATEVAGARERARGTLEHVRAIAQQMRPDVLDDLGLGPSLVALGTRLGQWTGTPVENDVADDLPDLPDEAELVVYRVAQEGITNALRHSGCSRIDLRLAPAGGDGVLLEVTDDGSGMTGGSGYGIRGMSERALLVGGHLEIESSPGAGTCVRLLLPLGEAL